MIQPLDSVGCPTHYVTPSCAITISHLFMFYHIPIQVNSLLPVIQIVISSTMSTATLQLLPFYFTKSSTLHVALLLYMQNLYLIQVNVQL